MSDALEEILSGWAQLTVGTLYRTCEADGTDWTEVESGERLKAPFAEALLRSALRSVAEEVVRRCEGMPLPRVHETWPKPYRVGWLDGAAAFGEALRSLFPTAFKEKA